MSRSGYSDDCEGWDLIRWRGAVAQATRGKRGQAFLHEMLTALDALPDKTLIKDELATPNGSVCAIGAVGLARGVDMTGVDPTDRDDVGTIFGIAPALAAEIVAVNDDFWRIETPEQRFVRMRAWVVKQINQMEATC